MDMLITFGISGLLLTTVVAFWIDEYRFALLSLGAATFVALVGGAAWVDGVFGAVLGSPLLLVLIPLAKRSKRRRLAKVPKNTVEVIKTALHARERVVKSQKETNRKADLEKESKMPVQAMADRLEADPISAVLRRQVPVRFDETARSWLGGLPQMPDNIPWPRGGNKNWPMHFAAQICCADLPERLWQGKGPREGWLLLFLDGYRISGGDEDEEDTSAVIYIDQLGQERQPPDDLHGVHDLYMSGASYPQAFDQSRVPSVWRRWPLDIVEQEQRIEFDKVIAFTKKSFAPTPTTEEELYGVAPPSRRPQLAPNTCPPRTWQGALDFVNSVTNCQRQQAKKPARDLTAKLREGDGWLKRLIAETEGALENRIAKRDEFASQLHELKCSDVQSADDKRRRNFLEEKGPTFANLIAKEQETLERLRTYDTDNGEAALEAEISASVSGLQDWWKSQGARLAAMRAKIEAKNLSTQISKDEWSALQDEFGSIRWPVFRSEARGSQAPAALRWDDVNLSEHVWGGDLLTNHYLDLYAQSPETRDLIPKHALKTVEDIARSIRWSRPHRMGGIADPLQSDIGPDDAPLLFQIASDDGMNWMWGDAGAIFIGTSDAALAARRFQTFANLECH
jgi:uncharacterized protein YwqG